MPHVPDRRPPRPTRREPRLGWLISAVVAVVATIGLFAAGATMETVRHGNAVAATPSATVSRGPGLRTAVRDGKFEFVVSRVDCSRTTVGLDHLSRTAKGRFCVVSLTVTNIAGKPQLFLGSWQKAYDAAGTEYGTDEVAGFYANRGAQTFLRKIDPGDRVTGKVVFDVPEKATLATVELHDSVLSGGVRVTAR